MSSFKEGDEIEAQRDGVAKDCDNEEERIEKGDRFTVLMCGYDTLFAKARNEHILRIPTNMVRKVLVRRLRSRTDVASRTSAGSDISRNEGQQGGAISSPSAQFQRLLNAYSMQIPILLISSKLRNCLQFLENNLRKWNLP